MQFNAAAALSIIVVLIVIFLIIFFVKRSSKRQKTQQIQAEPRTQADDAQDDQLVAVITAAVAAYMQKDAKEIKIRHIITRTYEPHNAWSFAGRTDNIGSSF